MLLVLCEPRDTSALWVTAGLKRLGLDAVAALPREIVGSGRFMQSISRTSSGSEIEIGAGRVIACEDLDGVLNRVSEPDVAAGDAGADRAYIRDERVACLAGWLASLTCPVVNPPDPIHIAGRSCTTSEWRTRALAVGIDTLPIVDLTWSHGPEVSAGQRLMTIVIGDVVLPRLLPDALTQQAEALIELARTNATPLLGATFAHRGGWMFDTATPVPDLRCGGDETIQAVAALLAAAAPSRA